ncbi:hypothetical protein KLA_17219 [Cellulophaga geojensis KL-A]|uniref:Uncharacterized protein n=1 Tax=Cellulophaga geojensis KL-A TaxID=1328323 RepID=A0ABN0RJ95_9FLAO|nr:hypothetical protein [Cellulophaga geojensis]EWH09588.1 hypothetical protein KLA_17219 [Cellulophaga geojensis KL-A]
MKKKKKILLIIGIITLIVLFTPKSFYEKYYYDFLEWKNLRNKIVWKKNIKLNWEDFRSTNTEENLVLEARVGLSIRYYTNPIMFKSKTVFMPNESFVINENDSINLRISEAKFNLLEIYRRKMEKYVLKLKNEKIDTLKKIDFDNLNLKYYELFETEWEKYLESQNETKSLENLEKRIKLEL